MENITNITKMLEGSLGLESPWYIEKAGFNEETSEFHIYIKVEKSARFACPNCGSSTSRNGYETEERTWRHSDGFNYKSYVHSNRPKVLCPHCGSVQISAPFERKNSRFTLAFEAYAMMLLPNMPMSKAAEILRCDDSSLANIMQYWVSQAVAKLDLSEVTSLAIDETSFKKGHSYVTVIIDADARSVIDVQEGKDKKTVENFAKTLENKGGKCENIEVATSDMSTSFLPAIAENFPNAVNIIDKFHVKKVMIDALDKVRKEEQKASKEKLELFRMRKLLMVPERKLTEEQQEKIESITKAYPQCGRAYRMVSAFDDFYLCETVEEAKIAFDKLYYWLTHSRLEPMKKAAQTLKSHEEKILNYFKYRYTNAICEGINSMVQAAKRKARGFRTFETYSAMIFLIAGKLQLAVPKVF